MDNLTKEQIQAVINWMNTWDQLKDTAIPLRFKEDFIQPKQDVKDWVNKELDDHWPSINFRDKEQKQVLVIKEATKDVLKSKNSSKEFLKSAGISSKEKNIKNDIVD